ncbi:MAG: hypothetical protein K8H77_05710, partial [Cutibacterium acnes]|nr:hypothetical protein [Cutibacterium acnes]
MFFLTRFAGVLVIACVTTTTLSAWIGTFIPSRLISLMVVDKVTGGQPLQLMDIHTGLVVRASSEPTVCCAVWSPDGTRIAFTGGGGVVYIWDQRDGSTRPLFLDGMNPALDGWSPDGGSLLFTNRRENVGYEELYHVDVAGGQVTQVIALDDPFKRIDFVQWSPDGRSIIFAQGTTYITRLWDIFRIEPDGKNLQPLSDGDGDSYAPRLSPDGAQIAYIVGGVLDND